MKDGATIQIDSLPALLALVLPTPEAVASGFRAPVVKRYTRDRTVTRSPIPYWPSMRQPMRAQANSRAFVEDCRETLDRIRAADYDTQRARARRAETNYNALTTMLGVIGPHLTPLVERFAQHEERGETCAVEMLVRDVRMPSVLEWEARAIAAEDALDAVMTAGLAECERLRAKVTALRRTLRQRSMTLADDPSYCDECGEHGGVHAADCFQTIVTAETSR